MWNARLDESQARTKTARRNIKSLCYANDTTLLAESEGELKNLWMRVREENEKAHLKHSIQKRRPWHLISLLHDKQKGERVEAVTDFIFMWSKITEDGHCNHEFKRFLLHGSKGRTNLDSAFNGRDVALLTTNHSVKPMVFPVVMYGCESKKIIWWSDHKEGWAPRNGYFQTVVLKKTLEVPWTSRRSNQSILKETNSEYSLKGLMMKLKLQYFGHLMRRADSSEKTLMLGKIEVGKKKGVTEDEMVGWHQ